MCTTTGSKDVTKNTIQVKGRQNLTKRSRAKYFARAFVLRMVDIESPLNKAYWKSFHCCDNVGLKESGDTVSHYCHARWCLVCNRIRSATMINTYLPVLNEWEDKYFVTLTVPNIPRDKLGSTIDEVQTEFAKIIGKFRLQHHRKKRDRFKGLRKLECTYNIERNDYHPHYHAIIQGEENANDLLGEWLQRFPDAKSIAQDVQRADNNSVREMFKYFTKLIVKAAGGESVILPEQLDVMFRVLRGRRTFQNFGFTKPKETEEVSNEAMDMAKEIEKETIIEVFEWRQELHDWIGKDSGRKLTGYVPAPKWQRFVERIEKGDC